MDAAIADSINRRDARLVTKYLDRELPAGWYRAGDFGSAVLGEDEWASDDDRNRFWRTLLGGLTPARIPGLRFDGAPADDDWEYFLQSLRAEVEWRRSRDPEGPHAQAAVSRSGGVV